MGKLLENHWTSHMERQTDEAEHEMLICHFRLGTRCVSLRRDRRYLIMVPYSAAPVLVVQLGHHVHSAGQGYLGNSARQK